MSAVIRMNAAPKMDERPICPGCNERLQPMWNVVEYTSLAARTRGEPNKVRWDGSYHSYGSFCTLRCATAYANAIHAERLLHHATMTGLALTMNKPEIVARAAKEMGAALGRLRHKGIKS